MAKKLYEIKDFSGGLNAYADPRDIKDTEFSQNWNVVVDKDARGSGLGQKIVQHCIDHARDAGCYKVILDCSNKNVPFYINCGMYLSENCMRIDL